MPYGLVLRCARLTFPAVSEGMTLASVYLYYLTTHQLKVRCYLSEQRAHCIAWSLRKFLLKRGGAHAFGTSPKQTLALSGGDGPVSKHLIQVLGLFGVPE